ALVRTNTTVIAALAVIRGEADAMICGLDGSFDRHLHYVERIIGKRKTVSDLSALSMLIARSGDVIFFTDTYVSYDPPAEELAETTILAAEEIRRFGLTPKAAMLSHSNFGSAETPSAVKMRHAAELVRAEAPDLMVDGEMHGDSALSALLRERVFPHGRLE